MQAVGCDTVAVFIVQSSHSKLYVVPKFIGSLSYSVSYCELVKSDKIVKCVVTHWLALLAVFTRAYVTKPLQGVLSVQIDLSSLRKHFSFFKPFRATHSLFLLFPSPVLPLIWSLCGLPVPSSSTLLLSSLQSRLHIHISSLINFVLFILT